MCSMVLSVVVSVFFARRASETRILSKFAHAPKMFSGSPPGARRGASGAPCGGHNSPPARAGALIITLVPMPPIHRDDELCGQTTGQRYTNAITARCFVIWPCKEPQQTRGKKTKTLKLAHRTIFFFIKIEKRRLFAKKKGGGKGG